MKSMQKPISALRRLVMRVKCNTQKVVKKSQPPAHKKIPLSYIFLIAGFISVPSACFSSSNISILRVPFFNSVALPKLRFSCFSSTFLHFHAICHMFPCSMSYVMNYVVVFAVVC